MRFVKQPAAIRIRKGVLFDGDPENGNYYRRHGELLPNTIRGIICGPSNCGKTNLVINLIESSNGLRFENVYVYSKSLQQLKYQYLECILSPVEGVGYFTFSNNSDVIPIDEALPNSIFIFDDVACEKQNSIRDYFSMGRHSNIDSFYLCQTYAKIPKHLIRDNANFLIIFQQDSINLKHIYNEHINADMSFDDFLKLCKHCWRKAYGFLVVDKDSTIQRGRYRNGFNEFAIIE